MFSWSLFTWTWFRSRSAQLGSCLALLVVLVVTGSLHLYAIEPSTTGKQLDDEGAYLPPALQAKRRSEYDWLPGRLPYSHRPPLTVAVYSNIIRVADARSLPEALTAIRQFQTFVLLGILVLSYIQGWLLGLGPGWSLFAPCLIAMAPRFGIYVHLAMSELFCALLGAAGVSALLAFFRDFRARYLALAGLVFGISLLVRASFKPFVAVLLPFLVAELVWRERAWRHLRAPRVIARVLLPVLALTVGVLIAVGPQLATNQARGNGLHISNNTWRNIEFGFRSRVPGSDDASGISWAHMRAEWLRRAKTDEQRELAAKRSTLEFLEAMPRSEIAARQLTKMAYRLVVDERTQFEAARGNERFRPTADWIWHFEGAAVGLWIFTLFTGMLGFVVSFRRGPAWRVLFLFWAALLSGFVLVPTSQRFVVVAVPVLCLGSAIGVQYVTKRLAEVGTGWRGRLRSYRPRPSGY
ncbi:MAG TPA: hypothetical protein VFQ61_05295 [Polyangiaceae bacterium]|nr:hypothetical protein [Polyangiaceae bacterium]